MESLDILIVDDDPELASFMRLKLSREAPRFSITVAEGGEECLDYLKGHPVDCIISDYQMPDMDGMELLVILREQGYDTPFIFLTGQGNEEVAREAFKNGAYDYFTKEIGFAHFARIINSVEQAVRRRDAEKEIKDSEFWIKESQKVARLGSYVLDLGTGRWSSSDILNDIFGIEKKYDKTVEGWAALIHPDDRDRMMKYFAGVLAEKNRFEADYRIIRPDDGQVRWVSGLGELVLGRAGTPVKMMGTIQDVTGRIRIEEALHESEKRFRALTESTSDWIWETDAAGRYTYSSPKVKDILGYEPDEVIGKSAFDFMPPEEAARVMNKFAALASSERPIERLENRNVTKDGRLVVLETSGVPYHDKEGRFCGYRGIDRDITARNKAEDALSEARRFLASVFMSIQDGVVVLDNEFNIVMVNPTMEKWFSGRMPLVGRKCYEAFRNRHERCEKCPSIQTMTTGNAATEAVPLYGEGGEISAWRELHSFPLIDTATGSRKGVIEYVRDITSRKKAEAERERLLKGVSASREGIAFTDKDDRFIYVNEAYAGIFGFAPEELTGKTWRDITPPGLLGMDEKPLACTLKEKEAGEFTIELTAIKKDGTTVPVEVNATAIFDETGEYQGHVCIVRDITERKSLERQRADFYAMVTHDIKSPLMSILGYSELLEARPERYDEETNEIISSIHHSGEKLQHLVEDFLAVSRIGAGKLDLKVVPTDISETLKDAHKELKTAIQKKRLSFYADIGEGLPEKVMMDPKLIHRAVYNLLQNAINYTPSGGEITLKAEFVEDGGASYVAVSVTDNGPGISADEQARVFDKYYRSPRAAGIKGTGLGLSIVKAVAEAHGGRVELDSEPGRGSVFRLFLPARSLKQPVA